MDRFIDAVGLKDVSDTELKKLYREIEESPDIEIETESDGEKRVELKKYLTDGAGIIIRGFIGTDGVYARNEVFPFCESSTASVDSESDLDIYELKNTTGRLSKTNVPMIACPIYGYIQNLYEVSDGENLTEPNNMLYNGMAFGALSDSGMILLPKGESEDDELKSIENRRKKLRKEFFYGKDEAYKELTLTEMKIYSKIDGQVGDKGVYGLLNTTFMPRGIESDLYFVIAVIEDYDDVVIELTGQHLYRMYLNSCGLEYELMINSSQLVGEPQIGRRFKGLVWMQSKILT